MNEGLTAGGSADALEVARRAVSALETELRATVVRLVAAGAHDEALGELVTGRRVFGWGRGPVIRPVGRAWRVGVLLLDREGRLYRVGEVTRAVEPGRAAVNRSPAGEARRELRRIASRSPFPPGEAINLGWQPLDTAAESLASAAGEAPGPDAGAVRLECRDGVVMLRWDSAPGALGVAPLARYLHDRVELLLDGDR
ncbi:hypothetical protein [Galbitalea soli]|uniref:Glutaminase n=1 Tax=Galbitalea soli TaxID=1268042 RepID=A0A7C9TMS6_9MICO|nr:hypothetical protein [Galbitalea soli]NEM89957.1 hypothetical protein [Galbitalea soli]NYJ30663.1 hypothetical protein [Galbitalea soli]